MRPAPILLLTALGALASCRTAPEAPPFEPPAVAVDLTHYVGSPLAGPLPAAGDAAAEFDVLEIRVDAVERLPEDVLSPVGVAARLIVSSRGERTLLAATLLGRGVRFGDGAEADARLRARLEAGDLGRTAPLASLRGALRAGLTARMTVDGGTDPGGPPIALYVTGEKGDPADGPLLLALVVAGIAPEEEDEDLAVAEGGPADAGKPTPPPAAPGTSQETILLGSGPGGGSHVVDLLVPIAPGAGSGEAFLVRLEVRHLRADDPEDVMEHEAAVDRVRRQAAAAAEGRVDPGSVRNRPSPVWPHLAERLEPGGARPPARRALAFLARTAGAALAEDVALAAPDEVVAALADRVFPRLLQLAEWPERDALAWILESEACLLLAPQGVEGGDPALAALLLRHTGEVGREPDLLATLVGESSSVSDLDRRILAENLVYLEDDSPGARLRAYDWLARRGAAPEGYGPLDPREARRAALRQVAPAEEPR